MMNREQATGKNLYWIAVNGTSCAMSRVPFRYPIKVVPAPYLLIGFPDEAEAVEAQRCCLEDPLETIQKSMGSWAERGDVFFECNANHQPQTDGPTLWLEA